MAKKENQNEFEELNDGGSINEADDSFGLPEIDYEPIDRTEQQPEASTEEPSETEDISTSESTESGEEQTFMYAHREEEEPVEPLSEQEFAEDLSEAETAASSDFTLESEEGNTDNIFGAAEESAETVESVEDTPEEPVPQENEYVPGSYTPKQESNSNTGAIIGVIAVIILAGLGIWYFMFERPRQAEIAAQEQLDRERAAQAEREREAAAAAEEQRLAEEQAAREAEEDGVVLDEENNEPGTVETISERTGRYYIIVTSSIDGDLAMDYAQNLATAGNSVKIIAPYGNVKFHRVAVGNVESLSEAESLANELKTEYGDGVWVMRY